MWNVASWNIFKILFQFILFQVIFFFLLVVVNYNNYNKKIQFNFISMLLFWTLKKRNSF